LRPGQLSQNPEEEPRFPLHRLMEEHMIRTGRFKEKGEKKINKKIKNKKFVSFPGIELRPSALYPVATLRYFGSLLLYPLLNLSIHLVLLFHET
jgi:hypothetical protein